MAVNTAPSFAVGGRGIVTPQVGSSYDEGCSVALQSDGKIVLAGINHGFEVARSLGGDGAMVCIARHVQLQNGGRGTAPDERSSARREV